MPLPLHRSIKLCLFEEVCKNKTVDRVIFIRNHHSRMSKKNWCKISSLEQIYNRVENKLL